MNRRERILQEFIGMVRGISIVLIGAMLLAALNPKTNYPGGVEDSPATLVEGK